MFHDWDVLQKDSSDLADAVQSLEWTVAPYVADGKEADAKAQEVAKTVTDALWKRTNRQPGTYSHTFPQLLNALVHALFRGFNVHEIEWVNDGELVYPAAFHQLPPQFMRWEDRAGEVDRLLFVSDGETATPRPFPANKYIVALNTSGPDHPLYNAMYYSLIAWYGAYKFGLGWFMEYCQKYGMPKLVFHYDSERDRQQLEADLAEERVLNNILLKGDRAVDIANAPASGASLPQRELLSLAESQCHKLILGQTLTSDTSQHGGSLAQAKVHAGVHAEVVKKRAAFVADVLNNQLIPAIVLLNYGTLNVPMPELVFKLPQEGVTLERVQVLKTALEIKGMRIKKSEAYEFMGFAQPAEGDDVFEAASDGGDIAGLAGLMGKGKPQGDTDPDDDPDKPKKKAPAQESEDVEPVSAANPYGCNQYGEGWKAPHNGRVSKPGAPMKKSDPSEEDKRKKRLEERSKKLESINSEKFDNSRSAIEIKTQASASQIAEMLNAAGYRYGVPRREKARAWEGVNVGRIYFGKDYITIKDGIITNRNLRKVRACTACDDAMNAINTLLEIQQERVKSARTDAPTDPAQEWLAPIKAKFLEARKAGASMADLKKMLLTMHPNTKALAKAFANNILAGFAGESEEVTAAGSNDDSRRRKEPIEMPNGTKCYTENCERHEEKTRQTNNNDIEYADDDNSRTSGRSEKERSGGAVQRTGQARSHSEQGGDEEDGRQLGRRVLLPESVKRSVQKSLRALGIEDEDAEKRLALTTTAQVQSVLDGRKPAFLEPFQELVEDVYSTLPHDENIRYVAGKVEYCIYNADSVRNVLSSSASGAELDSIVKGLIDDSKSGVILGYGYNFLDNPRGWNVSITANGEEISGFDAPPDITESEYYASERTEDFRRAFPDMEWSFRIKE